MGLVHVRPGEWDGSGGITLRAVGDHPSYMTAESTATVWERFVSGSTGDLNDETKNMHSTDSLTFSNEHGKGAASSSV